MNRTRHNRIRMIDRVLGHYRVLEHIGAGGMGVVYRARDERLDRDIALKVLPAGALADDAARRRFRKEALVLAKLTHPNIAMIFDFDTQDGLDFLAMEYVAGQSLAQKLNEGVMSEKDAIRLGAQVTAALEEAHTQSIVHRDLNPRNILVTPRGQAKVLDFGLATLLRLPGGAEATQSFADAEGIAGTLPYMAPEQLRGETLDGRADIYALGCTFYEMVTGRRPFNQDSTPQLTDEILHQPAVSPRAVNSRVSAQFETVILKCMEKDPEDRYQSAKELSVDLRRLGTQSSAVTAPETKPRRTKSSWLRMAIGGGIGAASIAALLFALNASGVRDRLLGKTGPQHIRSLAVLPLENLSHDDSQGYFADGMTEQLITDLAQISSLKVISRTSVMQYKGARKPLPKIAQELGVDAVVEGSVQRSGDRVRITAQLIDARADQHLWGRSYERDLRDVLAMQDEVAQSIANELKVQLAAQGEPRLVGSRPVDPQAYEAYLKGRYYSSKRTEKEVKESIEYFQQAVKKDPNYAPAYSGMADAYALLGYRGNLPSDEALLNAKPAALKAVELDDSLADAHASLAFIAETLEWDWPSAEREYKRALKLNPSYAAAHNWYAGYLMYFGRFEEGLAEAKRSRELDPLSLAINNALAGRLLLAGREIEAIEQVQKTLEMDPNFAPAHTQLGWIYLRQGKNEEAIAEFQKAVALSGSDPDESVDLGYAYAVAGKRDEAKKIVGTLKRKRERSFVSPAGVGIILGALGDRDEAFAWLEKAYELRDPQLTYLKVGPKFAPIRSDPRYHDLLRRMGLPS
jgi:serine/threonine protein kinase/tetratricopeptide (TPR) repeat protein